MQATGAKKPGSMDHLISPADATRIGPVGQALIRNLWETATPRRWTWIKQRQEIGPARFDDLEKPWQATKRPRVVEPVRACDGNQPSRNRQAALKQLGKAWLRQVQGSFSFRRRGATTASLQKPIPQRAVSTSIEKGNMAEARVGANRAMSTPEPSKRHQTPVRSRRAIHATTPQPSQGRVGTKLEEAAS
ncbi:hypothetical protein SCAR479_04331 [Seiridium cardinale]|uniref:Uncharacterized protein n=1 Tax=Seiridium cardinale TaxID=138064 RepID=A0ABR2XY21_9PEZI